MIFFVCFLNQVYSTEHEFPVMEKASNYNPGVLGNPDSHVTIVYVSIFFLIGWYGSSISRQWSKTINVFSSL